MTVPYLVHYDILLQNGIEVFIKWESYFLTKCYKNLLQLWQFYCKIKWLLQNLMIFLIKCGSSYKCDIITKCVCTMCNMFYRLNRWNIAPIPYSKQNCEKTVYEFLTHTKCCFFDTMLTNSVSLFWKKLCRIQIRSKHRRIFRARFTRSETKFYPDL